MAKWVKAFLFLWFAIFVLSNILSIKMDVFQRKVNILIVTLAGDKIHFVGAKNSIVSLPWKKVIASSYQ